MSRLGSHSGKGTPPVGQEGRFGDPGRRAVPRDEDRIAIIFSAQGLAPNCTLCANQGDRLDPGQARYQSF